MYELLWTILGVTVALAAMWGFRRRNAGSEPPAQPPVQLQVTTVPGSRELAQSLARELASLVSAVEGRAQHLIEAAPTRTRLPQAAEAMLASLQRLRHLHAKLVAFGRARPREPGTTDVCELIAGIGDELQQMQLGLELRWDPPSVPPRIDAGPGAVRDAVFFLCAGLLQAERGASRLTFTAERSFSEERPMVTVELTLERITAETDGTAHKPREDSFALDFEAARYLIDSHGGRLDVSHLPGKSIRAVLRLPMAVPLELSAPAPTEPAAPSPTSGHDFGGALVLESDPTLRAVLARELKASGRAVFACADGAAAHTFLQATPERFELLIVDDPHALDEHTPLGRTLRTQARSLKICLLAPTPSDPPGDFEDLHCLPKPFGVHELRRKLAAILAAG